MTGYNQQMPASHWSMSEILASDWLLDMTQPAYTTDIKMGRAGKRERGKNWEDFGAKTECTSCSTRQLRAELCFGLNHLWDGRLRTERPWTVLDGAITPPLLPGEGPESSRSSGGWETTSILDSVLCYQGRPIRGQYFWVLTNQKTRSNQTSILMMYFDTGGDIIPEISSQYIADHWKSDQFCTELGNNTQKTRVQQHVHALLRRPRGFSDIPEFKIGLSNFVIDF